MNNKVELTGDLLKFNNKEVHIGQYSLVNEAMTYLLKQKTYNDGIKDSLEAIRIYDLDAFDNESLSKDTIMIVRTVCDNLMDIVERLEK